MASRLTFHGAESLQGAVAAGLLGVGDRYAVRRRVGEVLQALIDAESCEAAAAQLVAEYRSLKRPVPGFGHPIHTGRDPRVEKLLSYVDAEGKPVQAARALEAALSEALGRPLVMNVSTALAVLMFDIGLPVTAMRGVVVLARCAGLVGHLLEEAEQPAGDALWRGAEAAVTYRRIALRSCNGDPVGIDSALRLGGVAGQSSNVCVFTAGRWTIAHSPSSAR